MSKSKTTLEPFDAASVNKRFIIGVDEVGRGCLAGPVYAGAVFFNQSILDEKAKEYEDLTDSKLISEIRREQLSKHITSSHYCGLAFATPQEIDQINILQASFLAMKRAIKNLLHNLQRESISINLTDTLVIVDGHMKIPNLNEALKDFPHSDSIEQLPLIKGDLRCKQVSAASIIAKVDRDQYMKDIDLQYPQYSFLKHKGYASAQHREAIKNFKPCEVHRKTFSGVKEHL